MKLSTTEIALITIFAALQALLTIFPLTFTIGVSGQITLGVIGGPLFGILLGPIVGSLAVLIGSLIGIFANQAGALFGIFTVIPPFLGALGSGYVKSKRSFVPGVIILLSILVFYANPIGREVLIYPWLHIIAMVVAFSPLGYKAGSWFQSSSSIKLMVGIAVATFLGILVDHIAGSAIAIWYYYPILTPQIWYSIILVYAFERIIMTVITLLVVFPVYSSLKKAHFLKNLQY